VPLKALRPSKPWVVCHVTLAPRDVGHVKCHVGRVPRHPRPSRQGFRGAAGAIAAAKVAAPNAVLRVLDAAIQVTRFACDALCTGFMYGLTLLDAAVPV
jgi:hypothetical protein